MKFTSSGPAFFLCLLIGAVDVAPYGRHSGTGLAEIHEDGSDTFTPLDSPGKREP